MLELSHLGPLMSIVKWLLASDGNGEQRCGITLVQALPRAFWIRRTESREH